MSGIGPDCPMFIGGPPTWLLSSVTRASRQIIQLTITLYRANA